MKRPGSGAYKMVIVALPLVVLVGAIFMAQIYLSPGADPPPSKALELVGYGELYNTDGTPLTLLNVGNQNLTILTVAWDGHLLTQGAIGGVVPMFATSPATGQNSSLCYQPTVVLIIPQASQWNMDTGGLCAPTIPAGGMATLYLGVFDRTLATHTVVIHTEFQDFIYTITPSNATLLQGGIPASTAGF